MTFSLSDHNTMLNMLFSEVIVLVRLQLTKELKAFVRNLQNTDHFDGGWRQFFGQLFDLGFIYAGDPVLRECIRYCFMNLLRQELNDFTERWIRHPSSKKMYYCAKKATNFPLTPSRFIRQCFMANSFLP